MPKIDPDELKRLRALRDDLIRRVDQMERGQRETGGERRDRIMRGAVVAEIKRQGGRNAEHLWELIADRFRLDAQRQTIAGARNTPPRSISQEIAIVRQSAEFSYFFTSPVQSPGTGANPFARATRNVTEAAALVNENPRLAKKLYNSAISDGSIDETLRRTFASWV